jgi:hypothetical protein
MSKEPESKNDTHDTRHDARHETRHEQRHEHETRASEPKAAPRAVAAPRDAAADQLKLLILLATDWLDNDRTHAREIAALVAGFLAAAGPPSVVDVPLVMLDAAGAVATCTMGNWNGEPDSYTYAWHLDGVPNSGTGAMYTVQPEDAGHSLACVVTATNALGSTVAPLSNSVAVPEAPPV